MNRLEHTPRIALSLRLISSCAFSRAIELAFHGMKRKILFSILILLGALGMVISNLDAEVDPSQDYQSSTQLNSEGEFSNSQKLPPVTFKKTLGIFKRILFDKKVNTVPDFDIPVDIVSAETLANLPEQATSIIRLGHSSVFIKISGQTWLIDPVFSERASPFSFFGPKRFHAAPLSLDTLPEIDGVIISHNHYDHMDEQTLKNLSKKVKHFVLPLGNAAQLQAWGIPAEKMTELDWWQSSSFGELKLVATPAQHFSGRGLKDRNKTLWSSWVLKGGASTLFFSGDSGYFDGFKTIGERYGPFDLTMMESGAYDEKWPDVHMRPEESARAHLDLRGRKMLPIHNGTFDLAFHPWTDPFEQLTRIADREWIDLLTPRMGQVLTLGDEASVDAARDLFWWRPDNKET